MDEKNPESHKKKHKAEGNTKEMNTDSMDGGKNIPLSHGPSGMDAEVDEADFRNPYSQRSGNEWQSEMATKSDPLSEDELEKYDKYNMEHPRRGLALVFNHKDFNNKPKMKRSGADQDGKVMQETLERLKFEVKLHEDKTSNEIKQILKDAAKMNHKDCDCILVAIMTHGKENGILASYDGEHNAEDVCCMFTSDKVPTLSGKPKIFLFQACRGTKVEQSTEIFDSTDDVLPRTLIIPSNADFLVAHSSIEGYRSFRNKASGSWFIQALCQDLNKSASKKDLLSIMTDTLRRVSYNKFSITPEHPETHNRQEMPILSTTLTRKLFF